MIKTASFLALAVFLGACTSGDQKLAAAKKETRSLQKENDQLRQTLASQDSFIRNQNDHIQAIFARLSAIGREEKEILDLRQREGSQKWKTNELIHHRLDVVEDHIKNVKDLERQLANIQGSSSKTIKNLRMLIDQKEREIEEMRLELGILVKENQNLKRDVASKRRIIENKRRVIENQNKRIETDKEIIRSQEKALRFFQNTQDCNCAEISSAALKSYKNLNFFKFSKTGRSSGFLEPSTNYLTSEYFPRDFRKLDCLAESLEVYSKKRPKTESVHKSSRLKWEKTGKNRWRISIPDPQTFWRSRPHLIIKVFI